MAENPYAAPKTRVEDAPTHLPDGDFLPDGRSVQAGNGWKWITDAWEFMAGQRWTFVGVFVLLMVINLVSNFVPIIGPLAVTLFSPVLIGGFVLGCDAVRQGEPLEVGHLFAGFQRHTGKLVGLGALTLAFYIVAGVIVVMIVGAAMVPLMMGGAEPSPEEVMSMMMPMLLAVLVVVALSLPLTMAILFATPLIVLKDFEIGAALKTSFSACLKNILPFLVWSVAALVLGVLVVLTLGLGIFIVGPVMMVSMYIAYRDIFHET
jgi:uncharacterized membrane protein